MTSDPSRTLLLVIGLISLCACHRAGVQEASATALTTCPARGAPPPGADSVPRVVRIGEGVRWRVGDRVVVVVDDTTRGIGLVTAATNGNEAQPDFSHIPIFAAMNPDDVAEL